MKMDDDVDLSIVSVKDSIGVTDSNTGIDSAISAKRMSAFVAKIDSGLTALPAKLGKAVEQTMASLDGTVTDSEDFGLLRLFDVSQHVDSGSASTSKPTKFAWRDIPPQEPPRLSPNYFIAVQVTNPEIHSKISEIQTAILKQNKLLKPLLVPLSTLHLTIMVMHIGSTKQHQSAKQALDLCRSCIVDGGVSLPLLSIAGLGNFRDSVIFAKIDAGSELDQLETIADTVNKCFTEHGLPSTDSRRGCKPHITVLKMSKAPELRKKGIKKIDPSFYSDYVGEFMGTQAVTSLQLCSMTLPKNKQTGYYHISYEVLLA